MALETNPSVDPNEPTLESGSTPESNTMTETAQRIVDLPPPVANSYTPPAVAPAQRGGLSLWSIPLLLVIGAALGYWLRPLLDQPLNPTLPAEESAAVAMATNAPPVAAADSGAANNPPAQPAAPVQLITPTPDQSAEIMAYIIANTRHFTGNLDATVTIVEFSDFL